MSTRTIPVVAETVTVAVRERERERVRVDRSVVEETRTIEIPIRVERIEIERVAVDRVVDEIPAPRQEGDTLIVPCVEEEVVVTKRLRLREELHIRKVIEERHEERSVDVRRQQADVTHEPPSPPEETEP